MNTDWQLAVWSDRGRRDGILVTGGHRASHTAHRDKGTGICFLGVFAKLRRAKISLDFKHSPCYDCCILSYGWFPVVWVYVPTFRNTPFQLNMSCEQEVYSETSARKIWTTWNHPPKKNTTAAIRFVMPCPPAFPSAWNNSAPIGRIFMKFDIWGFFKNLSEKFLWSCPAEFFL